MADPDTVRYWRTRWQGLAVGCVLCLVSIVLLKMFDGAAEVGYRIAVLLLSFVLLFVAGLYCVHRHWRAFRDDTIAEGGTVKSARDEWNRRCPPVD